MDDGESFTTYSKWVKKKAKLTALPQGQAQSGDGFTTCIHGEATSQDHNGHYSVGHAS
jgi:hypothetical protein